MFEYTLDRKPIITDDKGNRIVDLAKSIFARSSMGVRGYTMWRISDHFNMRPDLVSQSVYGSDRRCEYILKFAGISNPFTLCDDDVLLIPNEDEADGIMAANNPSESDLDNQGRMVNILTQFKFQNQEFKSDSTSYDNLAKLDIPSGVIDTSKEGNYMSPYISDDGKTTVTIHGGRMYFGNDSGMVSANQLASAQAVNDSAQNIINNALTTLSGTNCIYNGSNVGDLLRAAVAKGNALT